MNNLDFSKSVEEAAQVVGKTWPLYSFVTSNPLSGYEENSFVLALKNASKNLDSFTLPSAAMFLQAWENNEIDDNILQKLLSDASFNEQSINYLAKMECDKATASLNSNHLLDTIVTKWLSVFLDEGMAEWEMPNRKDGFYVAWRKMAVYDNEIGIKSILEIPKDATEALSLILKTFSKEQVVKIFKYHIAALPGYTGYIKYRITENSAWQAKYPITLEDYLAVRLFIANYINVNIFIDEVALDQENQINELKYIWLKAWEKTYQVKLVKDLALAKINYKVSNLDEKMPLAQFVFCIDTRSELIRRQIETQNNYETFGYAGFFGLATDYQDFNTGYVRKSCPPIVPSSYLVTEIPNEEKAAASVDYRRQQNFFKFVDFLTTRMKNMLPSAFGYVEGTGLFYGIRLISKTLFPSFGVKVKESGSLKYEGICTPEIQLNNSYHISHSTDVALVEKVAIVKSAFELLGWKKFAPIVVFVGHGSHSSNNPFASSLDCGACAASPGRHNARMLAKIANLPEVRNVLRVEHDLHIPARTIFIGAEHNTTTDGSVLFDTDFSFTHQEERDLLKLDLKSIQDKTIKARIGMGILDSKNANVKSNNWAETRPEWGLARNAAFIVGPRQLTKNLDLNSRCFLHSYNWEFDESGAALETIMQGPMVVTQWINNHYYFSTVDNDKFGGGSKITHNVVGKFGVIQGNGGDLKSGLPLQSVKRNDQELFHQPLRLSVVIQAPIVKVEEILNKNSNLKALIRNEWIYLLVMDPVLNNQTYQYHTNESWSLIAQEKVKLATAV